MTRSQLSTELLALVGDQRTVDNIFRLFGRLSPEPKSRPQVPAYDLKKVRRVGTMIQRFDFTDEQRAAARAILDDMGLI